MHIGMDCREECGKSPAQRRAPAIAAASLIMGDQLAPQWRAIPASEQAGRFQKTADYRRIADRVPSGGSDSMAET
jgi:hypothetical protein